GVWGNPCGFESRLRHQAERAPMHPRRTDAARSMRNARAVPLVASSSRPVPAFRPSIRHTAAFRPRRRTFRPRAASNREEFSAPVPASMFKNLIARRTIAILGIATVAAVAARSGGKGEVREGALAVAMVERRDFVRMLRIHGVIEAVKFHAVAAPRL